MPEAGKEARARKKAFRSEKAEKRGDRKGKKGGQGDVSVETASEVLRKHLVAVTRTGSEPCGGTRLPVGKARDDLSEILNRVSLLGERFILHRREKNAAALVSLEDLAILEALEDLFDLADAREAMAESDERIPLDEARRTLGF